LVLSSVLILLCTLGLQEQSKPAAPPPRAEAQSTATAPQKERSAAIKDKGTGPAKTPAAARTTPAAAKDRKPQPAAAIGTPSRATAAPQEVRVRTQAEMRKRSEFLMPPGSSPNDRYDPDAVVDWSEVPPWRQTSFFGIRARGQFFVYVVDCSGSMIDDDRFPRATIELRRSVMALREPQKFEVIFYNTESIPMPGGPIARTADFAAKQQMLTWLRMIEPDAGTDPRLAMKQALMLQPDAVFLLSDGEFPDGTVEAIARTNTRKIPIHCVDLAGGLGGDHLKRIARSSGGQYASRPGDLQGRP
jgi:hypothetical protein